MVVAPDFVVVMGRRDLGKKRWGGRRHHSYLKLFAGSTNAARRAW